jgi:hypothetical protein
MKKRQSIASQGALGLGALFLATNLCVGAETPPSTSPETPKKSKAVATAKKKADAARSKEKRAEITGSMIRYRVKDGQRVPETGLNVTVIDPQSTVNKGYGGPLETLLHNPAVYRGR